MDLTFRMLSYYGLGSAALIGMSGALLGAQAGRMAFAVSALSFVGAAILLATGEALYTIGQWIFSRLGRTYNEPSTEEDLNALPRLIKTPTEETPNVQEQETITDENFPAELKCALERNPYILMPFSNSKSVFEIILKENCTFIMWLKDPDPHTSMHFTEEAAKDTLNTLRRQMQSLFQNRPWAKHLKASMKTLNPSGPIEIVFTVPPVPVVVIHDETSLL